MLRIMSIDPDSDGQLTVTYSLSSSIEPTEWKVATLPVALPIPEAIEELFRQWYGIDPTQLGSPITSPLVVIVPRTMIVT